jgi:hypothetical protein
MFYVNDFLQKSIADNLVYLETFLPVFYTFPCSIFFLKILMSSLTLRSTIFP